MRSELRERVVSDAPRPPRASSCRSPRTCRSPGSTTRPTTRSRRSCRRTAIAPSLGRRSRRRAIASCAHRARSRCPALGIRPLTNEGDTAPRARGRRRRPESTHRQESTSLSDATDHPRTTSRSRGASRDSRQCCDFLVVVATSRRSSCCQFQPYKRGVVTRWSRLAANTTAPVTSRDGEQCTDDRRAHGHRGATATRLDCHPHPGRQRQPMRRPHSAIPRDATVVMMSGVTILERREYAAYRHAGIAAKREHDDA